MHVSSEKGFRIDVQQNILAQFAEQMGLAVEDNQLKINSALGKGKIRYYPFLGNLELYHFQFKNRILIRIQSANPQNIEWLLLNINLSDKQFTKTVNLQTISLQKYLPSGMMFYTSRTKVQSISPVGQPLEIALIRFSTFSTTVNG